MNRLKSLAVLALLSAAPLFAFAQNANAFVIFGHEDHYQYDRHHDKEWNRRRQIEWRKEHEKYLRERRQHDRR
jgi:hypothetical protein